MIAKRQLYFLLGVVVLFIVGTIGFSIFFTRYTQLEIGPETGQIKKGPVSRKPAAPEPSRLVPADPESFGMVVFNDNDAAMTQGEWDKVLSEKVVVMKKDFSSADWQKAREMIAEDPAKTAEKLRKIDELIGKFEAALRLNPGDIEARERLNRLRMLKSIEKELR